MSRAIAQNLNPTDPDHHLPMRQIARPVLAAFVAQGRRAARACRPGCVVDALGLDVSGVNVEINLM